MTFVSRFARERSRWQRAGLVSDNRRTHFMKIEQIWFGITDWSAVETQRKLGETGWADWRVRQFGDIRVGMLEYSPGYKADHWCSKGHILLCLEGELTTELEDGRTFILRPGMSYQVADGAEPHRSFTAIGAKLFVVD